MYRKFKKKVLGLLVHVMPLIFFSRILRSEALVYKSYFFRRAFFRKLFNIRFSYKHCNFSRVQDGIKIRDKVYTIHFWNQCLLIFHHSSCSHVLGNKKVHAYYVPSREKQAQFYERLAWDKALQWGKRQQMGSNRKNSGERSEPSGYLGRGKGWWSLEKCLWCRCSMIPDSGIMLWLVSSCWQICGAVDSITLFQYHTPTIQEKIF